jgi:hypothetical protein
VTRWLWTTAAASAVAALACVPSLPKGPVPDAMLFDPTFQPVVHDGWVEVHAPQPTSLLINPTTGHIDFSLAKINLVSDCSTSVMPLPADCAFDTFLQSLDGFPTVTPAQAPASAALDPTTITPGSGNVVVVGAKSGQPVTDLLTGFEPLGNYITLRPPHWTVGEFYWAAVRGYANGVKSATGNQVVASPVMFLLKQETSLTCGATDANIDPNCPAYALLKQQQSDDDAAQSLLQLEPIRQSLLQAAAWDIIAAAGIPKDEVAVLWGFPIHSNSVAELDPSPVANLVPKVTAPNQITVAVQGPVDAASVSAFVRQKQFGSVLVMDLTAANGGDLVSGLPSVSASYAAGNIVITADAAFAPGHQIGLFFTNAIHDVPGAAGRPLVPSPVSKLLTLPYPLLTSDNHSALLSVGDSDAMMLESGRQQLAKLFDMQVFGALTGVSRDNIVYCYAFTAVAP